MRWSKGVLFLNETTKEFVGVDDFPSISPETLEEGKQITEAAGTDWDFYELHSQFSQALLSGFKPEKVDGAFIAFIKKKTQFWPKK